MSAATYQSAPMAWPHQCPKADCTHIHRPVSHTVTARCCHERSLLQLRGFPALQAALSANPPGSCVAPQQTASCRQKPTDARHRPDMGKTHMQTFSDETPQRPRPQVLFYYAQVEQVCKRHPGNVGQHQIASNAVHLGKQVGGVAHEDEEGCRRSGADTCTVAESLTQCAC